MRYATPEWLADAWTQLPLALLHTLWLGAVAVAVLALVLRRTSAERPELRYGVSLAALGFVVGGWIVVWAGLVYGVPLGGEASVSGGVAVSDRANRANAFGPTDRTDQTDQTDRPDRSIAATGFAESPAKEANLPWRAWLANVWLAGVAAMSLRTAFLLRGAGQLRRASVPCDDERLKSLLAELRDALGVARYVALRISDRIDGPMVMGILWPAILLPAYVTTGVAPEHLRAALAHELAHIRRYDYLVNLFQLAVESLLFFNPAVWWISRQVRIEREACCDALAIRCTGGASEYAQALAAFVARSLQPTAALAMSGGKTSLVDRVRRILMPQDRPALRMSWFGLLAFLAIATALLAAFGGFSYLGVKLVAEAISPQERVEQVKAIEERFTETDYDTADRYVVRGTITTESGEPLPNGTRVVSVTSTLGYTASKSAQVVDGRFTVNVGSGDCIIRVQAEGYSIAIIGPFPVTNDAPLDDVSVVLRRGYDGIARFVDSQGRPVVGAKVQWTFPIVLSSIQRMWVGEAVDLTDSEGRITVEHCWDGPVDFSVLKHGMQEAQFLNVRLAQGVEEQFNLAPARPVSIYVRAKEDGTPVSVARIGIVRSLGRISRSGDPFQQTFRYVAESDANGRAFFDTIADGTRYWCFVEGPDGGRAMIDQPLTAGQEPVTVALGPPLTVSGVVKAPPDSGTSWDGPYTLEYAPFVRFGGQNHSTSEEVAVTLKDGLGEFVINDLWPGSIRIFGGKELISLDLYEPIDGVVVQLAANSDAEDRQFRTVVLQVQVPEDDPEVNGSVRIHYLKQPGDNAYANAEVPIENGAARYQVPVPTKIGYDVLDSPGYWVESESSIPVEPGDEPFVVELPTIPAGSIHGTVENAPDGQFGVSVVLVESPPGQDVFPLDVRSKRNERGYSLGPLPLGGTYIAAAHTKAAIALSEPITLTDRAPIQEVNLAFAPGVTVEGRVTYPDGSPANGLPLELSISTKYSHGFSTAIGVTGANGEFVVEHVDFDQPVTYAIILKPEKDFVEIRHEFSRGERADIQLERGLVLEGRLVERETGYPVPGVEVYAYSTQPETSIVDADKVTDREGRFRFTRMRDQVYQLGARDGANLREQVQARPGTGEPVELRVELAQWSTLRPVAPEEQVGGR